MRSWLPTPVFTKELTVDQLIIVVSILWGTSRQKARCIFLIKLRWCQWARAKSFCPRCSTVWTTWRRVLQPISNPTKSEWNKRKSWTKSQPTTREMDRRRRARKYWKVVTLVAWKLKRIGSNNKLLISKLSKTVDMHQQYNQKVLAAPQATRTTTIWTTSFIKMALGKWSPLNK